MNRLIKPQKGTRRPLFAISIATFLLLALWTMASADSTPLSVTGWLDHSYNPTAAAGIVNSPTGEKPESKLWWNDGYWWGNLFNPTAGVNRIYRLNWGTQTWEDTGVTVDPRTNAKADVLWDQANNTLYIASHGFRDTASPSTTQVGRLFKYTYNPLTQTYTPVAGFPKDINTDRTEILVIAQEAKPGNSNNLWATYVATDTGKSRVYANYSIDAGVSWTKLDLSTVTGITTTAVVTPGDISAIVAFTDTQGTKVGVMWSDPTNGENLSSAKLHFAWHKDVDPKTTWTLQSINLPNAADDHINLKSLQTTGGAVFAAIKMNTSTATSPLNGVVARDTDGSFSFHLYSNKQDDDTRPIVVVDRGNVANTTDDQLYMFVSGKSSGSKICYKPLTIKFPLATMGDFPQATQNGNCGTSFIEDIVRKRIDDPTSTKQNVNSTTGIVVAASDNITGHVYVHNVLGDPPPVVTSVGPARGATGVLLSAVISATFSKPMDQATFNATSFSVVDGANVAVPGAFAYNVANRLLTFTPLAPLAANTTYTVKLTKALKDTSTPEAHPLYQRAAFAAEADVREQWSFTTEGATVQFSAADYSVIEGGGTAIITVTLSSPSQTPVSVNYATSNGTAIEPGDYTATSGTLNFAAGETSKTFAVPVIDNITINANKTVSLTLSSPTNASLGAQTTATLTIIDEESPSTAQFSVASYSVAENVVGGNATITVILNKASATPLSVDYATSNGTATAGSDYTAASGTLTFAVGETSKTFAVAITNDNIFEPNETVNLTLSGASASAVPAMLTIVSDDLQPTVQFSAATYSTNEGGTATINVTLSNPSSTSITVNYATSDSTAGALDYTAASGLFTFAAGETSKSFDVATTTDSLSEPDEEVQLTLSNPVGATFGPAGRIATLTIVDVSTLPTIQFSAVTYSVNENTGTGVATILVTLSAASAQPVEVGITTSNGTATAGSDYAAIDDFLTIDAGLTSGTFDVPITDDNAVEGNETVNLSLGNPTNAVLGVAAAVLTIVDNETVQPDLPTVQFSAATYSVNENGGTATITATLSSPSAQPVSVNFTTANGTATAGSDYATASGTLNFAANETVKTFSITITDDAVVEPSETVNLTLSTPNNATLGTPQAATLTIVDNDTVVPPAQQKVFLPLILKH
ncbi:hypothetical protein BH10CHL1_BH10CHL1_39540 [soil metagenome]